MKFSALEDVNTPGRVIVGGAKVALGSVAALPPLLLLVLVGPDATGAAVPVAPVADDGGAPFNEEELMQ